MFRSILSGSCFCLLLPMVAVASPPKVAADIAPVHSLVAQVMAGVGEPDLVIPAGASPHEYSLRPSEAEALARADVVFWIGEDLAPWLETPIENLAGSATKVTLLEVPGITLLGFREGATFEAHDHHGEEGHDEHGHKDEHAHADEHGHEDEHAHEDEHGHEDEHAHEDEHGQDDEHGEGHGGHGFEWAGVFDLSAGTYKWSFAKVDGDYADPAMKMVILESDGIESSEEMAEELLEAKDSETKRHNDVLVATDKAYVLSFDETKETTVFTVAIEKDGKYAFFTEHMPFEFEADEHFFKDDSGDDVEPVAQAPEADHHHHHHHGEHDPHAWLDPENAKIWVETIASVLSEADAANAAAYRSNAASAIANLDDQIASIRERTEKLHGIKFIVFHDAYQYFERRFDVQATGAISLGDASDPSPARVAEIRDTVARLGIQCVFTEPQFNPDMVVSVFERTEVTTIGVMDPLGAHISTGQDHYSELLEAMVSSLSQCQN